MLYRSLLTFSKLKLRENQNCMKNKWKRINLYADYDLSHFKETCRHIKSSGSTSAVYHKHFSAHADPFAFRHTLQGTKKVWKTMPRIPRPLFKLATAGEAEAERRRKGIARKKAAPFAANFVNHDIVINFCSRNTKRDSRVGVHVRVRISASASALASTLASATTANVANSVSIFSQKSSDKTN